MALESATYVSQLVSTNPSGSDSISQGDDHLKLIKAVMKTSFPDVDQAAATIIVKATAPTTLVKGTIWFDTTAVQLKVNTATTGATAVWSSGFFSAASSTAFRATMSTTQSVPNVALRTVVYDTDGTAPTSYDLGTPGNFDTSTYKYTVPNTGYYFLSAAVRFQGASGAHSIDDDLFLKRTVTTTETTIGYTSMWMQGWENGTPTYIQSYPTWQVQGIFSLNKNDTVHVAVYTEGGAFVITGGEQAYFQGFQVA